jgi:hypothetical protein
VGEAQRRPTGTSFGVSDNLPQEFAAVDTENRLVAILVPRGRGLIGPRLNLTEGAGAVGP